MIRITAVWILRMTVNRLNITLCRGCVNRTQVILITFRRNVFGLMSATSIPNVMLQSLTWTLVCQHFFNILRTRESLKIIITADHGEELDEYQLWYDHHGLYRTSCHVPLIVPCSDVVRPQHLDGIVTSRILFLRF